MADPVHVSRALQLPEVIWEKMPEECLAIIADGMPAKTQIARRARRELDFRKAIAVTRKAHKIRRDKKCPLGPALWEACLNEADGDNTKAQDLYTTASNEARRIKDYLRKYRATRRKKKAPAAEATLFVGPTAATIPTPPVADKDPEDDDIPF